MVTHFSCEKTSTKMTLETAKSLMNNRNRSLFFAAAKQTTGKAAQKLVNFVSLFLYWSSMPKSIEGSKQKEKSRSHLEFTTRRSLEVK